MTSPTHDQSNSTLVTIDLPAIETYAGRVDRLAAEVSLARSFAVAHGEVRRSYAGEIVGWDASRHAEVLDYVDGVLHQIAVATRKTAERLRDSRDAYATALGASEPAVTEIWAADGGLGGESIPTSSRLALAASNDLDERTAELAGGLDRLAADCGRWASTLADGLSALIPSWTDPAAECCATYVHRVVDLVSAASDELSTLATAFGAGETRIAA